MSDWLNIAGKVYVVTGGSSGIGKAIVDELLESGANVANLDLNENDTKNEHYLFIKTDVTNHESVAAAVSEIVAKFGTINGLVNNAGINMPRLLVDVKHPGGEYDHQHRFP